MDLECEPTREELEAACAELVAEGLLEVIGEVDGRPVYRKTELFEELAASGHLEQYLEDPD